MIDTAIHPFPRHADDLRSYMSEPWRSRPFPGVERQLFPAPTGLPPYGEWVAGSRASGEEPASDPAVVLNHLDAIGADRAILVPLTRGLNPHVPIRSMICAATNDWLADTWLGSWNQDNRFVGSIRLNPSDPEWSIRELKRWADDRRMVQVAVPLEAHQPYGQRVYLPLWQAIEERGLPIAVTADGGAGVEFYPGPTGYPHTFAEWACVHPLASLYHLTSLIAEGVFERLPGLQFVFVDGGHDLVMPLAWRMDLDWPIAGSEAPWVRSLPSAYLADHVRFTTSILEGPGDENTWHRWWRRTDGAKLLMFGSHYPRWTSEGIATYGGWLDKAAHNAVFSENAAAFYGRM